MSVDSTVLEAARAEPAADAARREFLTCRLGGEHYGIDILMVQEIREIDRVTRVPHVAPYVRGVINLRGKVIPVMDLRVKFGMSPSEPTDQTVIIVVQCQAAGNDLTMGVLVDQVLEVLSIQQSQIEPPPCLGGASFDTEFILGIGKTEDRVVFLLDIGRVLSGADHSFLSNVSAGG